MNHKIPSKKSIKTIAATAVAALTFSNTAQAQENPIDCEILICMAAGFPTASGCGPAYTEVLDRVTPWPIEPPLQLWNCPLNIPKEYGNYEVDLESPEYSFATSFRVFNININMSRRNGKCNVSSTVDLGTYDETGAFTWDDSNRGEVPEAAGLKTGGCAQRVQAVFIDWEDEQGTYSSQMIRY